MVGCNFARFARCSVPLFFAWFARTPLPLPTNTTTTTTTSTNTGSGTSTNTNISSLPSHSYLPPSPPSSPSVIPPRPSPLVHPPPPLHFLTPSHSLPTSPSPSPPGHFPTPWARETDITNRLVKTSHNFERSDSDPRNLRCSHINIKSSRTNDTP